jgi:hypothetical protein
MGACDFLRRKFTSLNFPLVLLALISLSDFYFPGCPEFFFGAGGGVLGGILGDR